MSPTGKLSIWNPNTSQWEFAGAGIQGDTGTHGDTGTAGLKGDTGNSSPYIEYNAGLNSLDFLTGGNVKMRLSLVDGSLSIAGSFTEGASL